MQEELWPARNVLLDQFRDICLIAVGAFELLVGPSSRVEVLLRAGFTVE